jgi:hypothetical protein
MTQRVDQFHGSAKASVRSIEVVTRSGAVGGKTDWSRPPVVKNEWSQTSTERCLGNNSGKRTFLTSS